MFNEDRIHEGYLKLLRERIPWLILGLLGVLAGSSVIKNFEQVLEKDLSIAFFIPVVVYIADAIGTQTETIFIRGITQENFNKRIYLLKEILIGNLIGILTGIMAFFLITFWFSNPTVAFIVGLSMYLTAVSAVIIATLIPLFFMKLNIDPAFGSGPFATLIQDLISLFIYFQVASIFLA